MCLHFKAPFSIYASSPGLFHRVIMQSGSPFSFWATYNTSVKHEGFLRAVAEELGCRGSVEELVDCLRGVSVQDIITKHWEVQREGGGRGGGEGIGEGERG
jgi:carboxylesterase type B